MITCDFCGKNSEYYCSTKGSLNCTLCEDCFLHIPAGWFSPNKIKVDEIPEEFTMILLKFGNHDQR